MVNGTQAIISYYSANTDHKFCPKQKGRTLGAVSKWISSLERTSMRQSNILYQKPPLMLSSLHFTVWIAASFCLARFLECKTQNINESFYNVIWSLTTKSTCSGHFETKLAVELGTLLFNANSRNHFNYFISILK